MTYFDAPYRPAGLTVDSSHSLVANMQAWFPLTAGSGTVAQCILHPSHTGTIGSGVTWESSERGTVAVFDGTSNARISLSSALISGQTLSFSVWLYINTSTAARVQIYSSAYAGHVKNQFRFSPLFNNFTFDQYPPGGGGIDTPADTGVEGRWVHAVVTQDSSDTKIYYDGELKVTGTAETYSGSAPTVFDIGSDNGANSFDGKMQNFQAWDRVITADEVALLHSRPWTASNYDTEALWLSPPASPTLSTASESTSIMADIEGWWAMTDGSGTTLKDISGNGRDATLYGTNTWENETLGTANRFDNSVIRNSHAETANTQPDLTGGYTFSTWVKHEELVQGGGNKYGAGIVLGNSLGSSDLEIYYRGNHTAQHPQVVHNRSNGGTNAHYYIDNNNFTDDNNVWVNFVVTHDGSTLKFYRDGVYQRSRSNFAAPSSTSGYKIYLNELPVGASNSGLTCSMQNTRLYSRALSDSEISLLYERPWIGAEYNESFYLYPPVPSSLTPLDSSSINTDLQGWWPLTETGNFASGAADISGNGNNGTQSGGVLSEFSELGTVASFDGVDDNFGMASPIYTHGAVSASAWFKWDGSATFNSILGNYISSTSHDKLYVQYRHDTTTLRAYLGSQNSQVVAATVTLTDWHHIAVTWDLSTAKLYLDGVQIDSVAYSSTSGTQSTSNFTIGDRASDGSLHAGGDIQNVRLWSRNLSSTEVANIYYSPWLGSAYTGTSSDPATNRFFSPATFARLG